jgi:hypothetical protein
MASSNSRFTKDLASDRNCNIRIRKGSLKETNSAWAALNRWFLSSGDRH